MASRFTILFNALMFFLAFLRFGGWASMVVFYMPHISIPASLVMGAIAYGILEALGRTLNALSSLTLLNLLAACSVICLLLGFLPSRFVEGAIYSNPFNVLFEDYVISLVFYSALLQIMGAVWWLSCLSKRSPVA